MGQVSESGPPISVENKSPDSSVSLFGNSGLLTLPAKRYESGYTFTREGLEESSIASPACLVRLTNIGKVTGARQEVVLKQNEPKPMLLHGWSMALNITGGSLGCGWTERAQWLPSFDSDALDSPSLLPLSSCLSLCLCLCLLSGQGQPADYSLYSDIAFMDGSHAWGEYCPFDQTKSGEWQETFGVIDHDKPIHSVVVVLMLRWRQGSAIFDSVSLTNIGDGICGCNHLIQ